MKIIFDNKKEFEDFKVIQCPSNIGLREKCTIYDLKGKGCEKCWKEALKNIPENMKIEVKENEI